MFEDVNRERWHLSSLAEESVNNFATALNIDPLLSKVLLARKIGEGDVDKVRAFLKPDESMVTAFNGVTSDEDLKNGVDRVEAAVKSRELIMINGDPDADGITGATILVSGLRFLGATVEYDFPTRSTEGHGLQPRIIDEAKAKGAKLVITSDCGSNDIPAVEYARTQGLDVIICDHHILSKVQPTALAMINPYRVTGYSPFKYLSGAGISFKFLLAIFDRFGTEMPAYLQSYLLALVTLGTVSDRMSLLEPMNRILIQRGIDGINNTQMEGLKALKEISAPGFKALQSRDISRTIVPRLNAPGRIGDRNAGIPDSRIVVDLLLLGAGKHNAERASTVMEKFSTVFELEQKIKKSSHGLQEAALVDDVNEQRKYMTSKIEDEIDEHIKAQVNLNEDRIIVVRGHNWNPGVIGIDTDRLRERFLRPAMILTSYTGDVFVRGSVRSIPTINVYQVINAVGEAFFEKEQRLLYQTEVQTENGPRRINAFGGHSQACGFTIHEDDIPVFLKMLHAEMAKVPPEQFHFSYEIIDTLKFAQLGPRLVDTLEELAPYGQYFEVPIFYLKRCQISQVRTFGNRYQHTRTPHMDFIVTDLRKDKTDNGKFFPSVGFSLSDKYNELKQHVSADAGYDIIFVIERHQQSRRNGKAREQIRLNVLDIRPASDDNVDQVIS